MTALLVGSVLAVLGLGWVLLPLLGWRAVDARAIPLAPELPPEASALDALREIEFDQATGKLSAEDYSALRASYAPLAMAELRAREQQAAAGSTPSASNATPLDAAELLIARAKSRAAACVSCGPRPEPDALYCSDCGRSLIAACLSCGARVEHDRARFCTECGSALAA